MIPGRPVRALMRLMNETTQLRTCDGVRPSVTSRSRVICRSPDVGRTTSQKWFAWATGSLPGRPKWYAPRIRPTFFIADQLEANRESTNEVPSVALQNANVLPLFLTLVQLIAPCQWETSIPW